MVANRAPPAAAPAAPQPKTWSVHSDDPMPIEIVPEGTRKYIEDLRAEVERLTRQHRGLVEAIAGVCVEVEKATGVQTPDGRCPSGAHLPGECECEGIPRLAAGVALLMRSRDAARAEAEALRTWQREVAEGIGYLNRAEGQDGYEVAAPSVIVAAWREAEKRTEVAECVSQCVATDRDDATADADRMADALSAAESRAAAAEGALRDADAALERARDALNHDRTGLAAALEKIGGSRGEVAGRYWLLPLADGGGWASYSYKEQTEETLRKEIGWAFRDIGKIAMEGLRASGNLAHVEINAITEALGRLRVALAASPAAPEAPWPTVRGVCDLDKRGHEGGHYHFDECVNWRATPEGEP
jgi:hypothetical protein